MKKLLNILVIILCLVLMAGCSVLTSGAQKPSPAQSTVSSGRQVFPYRFQDSLNNRVTLKARPSKVVCLMGSYAEMWILAGGTLAGTTDDAISERKLDLGKDVEIIGSVKEPDMEKVLALSPDFVILSSELQSHLELSEKLKQAGVAFAYFKVNYFDDYLHVFRIFTEMTGRDDLYQKNGLDMQTQVNAVLNKVDRTRKPTVLFIRASSSGVEAQKEDSMTGKILKDLNCENIADRHPSLLQSLSMEDIIMNDPDFIFVTTMGSSKEKALSVLKKDIQSKPAWQTLSAVRENHYYILPKELFQYKPNAKWGMSYVYLSKLLYPVV